MKEVFIERSDDFIRIAVLKDKKPILFYVEDENELFPGQIYKGTVKNIVPAIKGAFIDIGKSDNVFMPLNFKLNNSSIKKGDEIIVEVLKNGDENKKAKVTSAFSLPGRYVVLDTLNKKIAFSSKLKNCDNINKIKENIKPSKEFGFIIRSNAENVSLEDIISEAENLKDLFHSIVNKAKYSLNNGLIYDVGGVIEKVLRDIVDENTSKIYINNNKDYLFIKDYIDKKNDIKTIVELYQGERTLFHNFNLEDEIMTLLNKKVILESEGFIIIDKTEAMHVIDVNSGKNIKSINAYETALKVNLEAARECAKQIILRNLGGIILIDFIDMKSESDKKLVIQEIQRVFEENNDKAAIYPFTQLNLLQVVRRKRGRSILEFIEEGCTSCNGIGLRIKLSYIFLLIRNDIIKYKNLNNINEFIITLNPYYKDSFENKVNEFLAQSYLKDCKIYVDYSYDNNIFKVEPLLFESKRKSYDKFKVYG